MSHLYSRACVCVCVRARARVEARLTALGDEHGCDVEMPEGGASLQRRLRITPLNLHLVEIAAKRTEQLDRVDVVGGGRHAHETSFMVVARALWQPLGHEQRLERRDSVALQASIPLANLTQHRAQLLPKHLVALLQAFRAPDNIIPCHSADMLTLEPGVLKRLGQVLLRVVGKFTVRRRVHGCQQTCLADLGHTCHHLQKRSARKARIRVSAHRPRQSQGPGEEGAKGQGGAGCWETWHATYRPCTMRTRRSSSALNTSGSIK